MSSKFSTPKTLIQQYCFIPAKYKVIITHSLRSSGGGAAEEAVVAELLKGPAG